MLNLPRRTTKPRSWGITAIMDLGLPIGYLREYLEDYHSFIDLAKLGIGSAYITPSLKEKIKVYRDHGVSVCFGGTLFEKFYMQSTPSDYCNYLCDCGVDWIEISDGTIEISLQERLEIIAGVKENFGHIGVVSEVGCKQTERADKMTCEIWIEEIRNLLAAGCSYVIIEGRATGTGGIFQEDGTLRVNIFDEILKIFDHEKLIIEAPTHKNQAYFINRIGANVNLGNIAPNDILFLESLRQGLRAETFNLEADLVGR